MSVKRMSLYLPEDVESFIRDHGNMSQAVVKCVRFYIQEFNHEWPEETPRALLEIMWDVLTDANVKLRKSEVGKVAKVAAYLGKGKETGEMP